MAAVTNQQLVAALYAAVFNRAPDQAGLNFWTQKLNEGESFDNIAAGFAQHEVFTNGIGQLNNADFVAALYTNILGSAGEQAGIESWVARLEAGESREKVVADFVQISMTLDIPALLESGALTAEEAAAAQQRQDTLLNKAEVGIYFADTLGEASNLNPKTVASSQAGLEADPMYQASQTIMKGVNNQASSVQAAKDTIAVAAGSDDPAKVIEGEGQNNIIVLKPEYEVVKGTSGNDTFVGAIDAGGSEKTTYSPLDQIDGADGIDTLAISVDVSNANGDVLVGANVKNVEIVNVNAFGTSEVTVNTVDSAAVTNLNITAQSSVQATAANTTDVNVTLSEQDGEVIVNDGKDVTVKTVNSKGINTADSVTVENAAGNVTVEQKFSYDGKAAATAGDISIDGGKTVNVNVSAAVKAKDAASGNKLTLGNITVESDVDTQSVSIKQSATLEQFQPAGNKNTTIGSNKVTFLDLPAGKEVTVAGLTFTAAKNLTAAEVAEVFANLTNSDTQNSVGVTEKGFYTGSLTPGYTSGAAVGNTVTFVGGIDLSNTGESNSETLKNDFVLDFVAEDKIGQEADLGAVTVVGNESLESVSIDGYKGPAAINGASNSKLQDIALANGSGANIASAAETLNLALNNVDGTVSVDAGVATLNVTGSDGVDATITSANNNIINVNVAGTGDYTLDSLGGSFTTLKVRDSANVTAAAAAAATLTSVDTTAATGTVEVTIRADKATYQGGAGVDNVTFDAGSAADVANKALDLGAGNDTLDMSAYLGTFAKGQKFNGGEGFDTIKLSATQASTDAGVIAQTLVGFEQLQLAAAAAATTVDLAVLDYNFVKLDASTVNAGIYTLKNANDGITVELSGSATGSAAGVVVEVEGADKNISNVVNLVSESGKADLALGTATIANVETINIATNSSVSAKDKADGLDKTNALTLTADKATTVNLTGNGNLKLTLTDSDSVKLVDGSTATGDLTVEAINKDMTVKGGAGDDTITVSADGVTVFGGAGKDTYVVNVLSAADAKFTTITGSAADLSGDVIEFTNPILSATKIEAGNDLASTLNAATQNETENAVYWFQFEGNTYVVQDSTATAENFDATLDGVVKIAGLVDLTFNDSGILEIA